MIRQTPEFDQRIADWLEADPTTAPHDVMTTVAAALPSIPQARRGLLAPWRFSLMTNTMRAAAAIAIFAIVGVGILAFNTFRGPTVGTDKTPVPTLSPAPTSTPAPSGIASFKSYTSEVYGITFGYPDHWRVEALATRAWKAGDGLGWGPSNDIFISPDGQIALAAFRMAAEPGADIGSRQGLGAYFCKLDVSICEPVSDAAVPMCLGRVACQPAVVVPLSDGVLAYFADAETRMLTVVTIGQPDSFAGAAQYGGSVQLLKSILTTMDVWTPEPGQIPPAS